MHGSGAGDRARPPQRHAPSRLHLPRRFGAAVLVISAAAVLLASPFGAALGRGSTADAGPPAPSSRVALAGVASGAELGQGRPTGQGSDSATNGTAHWTLWTNSTNPPARESASISDDPALGGVLLFGGLNASNVELNDTWLFRGGVWTELCSGTSSAPFCRISPPAEFGAAMAYDAVASEVVLFAGDAHFDDNLTWVFHNGTWSNVSRLVHPDEGVGTTMASDPAVGGLLCVDTLGYTWSFSNDTWTKLERTPNDAFGAALFYDPSEGGVVLWGGDVTGGGVSAETWLYAGGNWTELSPVSYPAGGSPLGWGYDAELGSGFVFGPEGYGTNSTWVFANGNWTNASARLGTAPPANNTATLPAIAYDSTDAYVVALDEIGFRSTTNQTWLLVGPLSLNITASAAARDLGQTLNYSVQIQGGIDPYAASYISHPPGCVPPSAASTNFTVSCVLNETGYYQLNLNVSDEIGTAVGVVVPLLVNADPTVYAYADPNPTDVGIPGLLWGTASHGTGAVNQSWVIGGGPPQAGSILRVNFTEAGTIDAVFTAVDGTGFRVNATVVVVVNPYPMGEILPSRNVTDVGLTVNFSANQTGGSNYVSEGWVFGDGSASAGLTTSHIYRTPGIFRVGLWTNDSAGAGSFVSLPMRVNPDLAANASANDSRPLVGSPVEFRSVTAGGTGPDTFRWSFGDGSSSDSPTATHAYSLTGTFNATLVVNDSVGGNQSTHISIDVVGPPIVRISPPNVTINRGYSPTELALSIGAAGVVGIALGVLIGRARKPPQRAPV
jgi:hypothetical protein